MPQAAVLSLRAYHHRLICFMLSFGLAQQKPAPTRSLLSPALIPSGIDTAATVSDLNQGKRVTA